LFEIWYISEEAIMLCNLQKFDLRNIEIEWIPACFVFVLEFFAMLCVTLHTTWPLVGSDWHLPYRMPGNHPVIINMFCIPVPRYVRGSLLIQSSSYDLWIMKIYYYQLSLNTYSLRSIP
jgi:hypothetical protein